ncbi:MAG: putative sialic acid transporter, partial [Pseudomonadota bacterium]
MRKLFQGWKVVIAGASLQFLHAGFNQQSFGAYVALLASERGWSKTSLSGAAALQSVETAIVGPLVGWLIDRFGERRVIQLGVLFFGLGMMGLSQVETLLGFYIAAITIAFGTSLCGYFPINVAVIHWFEKKRGRALSSVGLGMALGGIMVPIVAASMQYFGWRATAFGSGVFLLLAGLPIAATFKGRPHELGEYVDGERPVVAPQVGAGPGQTSSAATPGTTPAEPSATPDRPASLAPSDPGFTAREALRTRAFWLLSIGHGTALLVVTAINVHAITHMKEGLGYSLAQASWIIMVMTLSQIIGVGTGMLIGDRVEKRLVAAACMMGHALGILALAYASNVVMLVLFAVLHGTAWGLRGPFMQAIRADYFGRRSIGMILGLSAFVIAIGQMGGPMIAGGLADLGGDYRLGFTL